ncbi:unnamed protein product [Paramecium octaurelia]|uniref:Uncharacterized protein n=1 Tax=Paramecium octaurelia TaxID=43137 RepID=A0A8S1VUF4_PAROT|nr:unnamed protein product [Paramecium octaurelia]
MLNDPKYIQTDSQIYWGSQNQKFIKQRNAKQCILILSQFCFLDVNQIQRYDNNFQRSARNRGTHLKINVLMFVQIQGILSTYQDFDQSEIKSWSLDDVT